MTERTPYGLAPRIGVPILGGGLFYLIALYVFSYPHAAGYGITITVVSGGLLILQYLFQRFRGTMPRILMPILPGGLYYLIAHYVFSYSHAAGYGILITLASGGFLILQYLFEPSLPAPDLDD